MIIQAITLWQHWASAMALGEKGYETRGWDTDYRGLIAVHSAKTRDYYDRRFFERLGITSIPFGCILSIHELLAVHRVEGVRDTVSHGERLLGDYTDGRFAWEMPLVYRLPVPLPARGYQKLWRWDMPESMYKLITGE
jgi:hypothetical protein